MTFRRPGAALGVLTLLVALTACATSTGGDGHESTPAGGAGPSGNAASSGPPTSIENPPTDRYHLPESHAAAEIPGIRYHVEPGRSHVQHPVRYDTSPPTGGDHSQYWADCTGTVYLQPIANENAVHALEHGAVWITYRQGLNQSDVDALARLVRGQDRMLMSPFPGLKTTISLQSWGYQLVVDSPSDPRVEQFIDALRYNPQTTPEPGADCSQPTFKQHPSTFGHPLWVPAQ